MATRVVFMGSPQFSVMILRKLTEHYNVVGVVTQPDRPAGRGKVLASPPIKRLAQELGIDTIQPNRLREPDATARLESWQPDLILVAAFGQILRQNVLDMPKFGCINVHASLLPRWRGVSPIPAALLNGDKVTGITIMKMDAGVDTGPILSQKQIEILPDDTAGSLSERLSRLGAELLIEILPEYLSGSIQPKPQDSDLATYAGMLKKEDGRIDFSLTSEELARRVRAFNPWPGAFTIINGDIFKIHRAHAVEGTSEPGNRGVIDHLPAIGTSDGWLVLDEVQPAGKKIMTGDIFLRGFRDWSG